MTDPIKNQVEGRPLILPADSQPEAKAQVESTAARRHREMMQALTGEIPNAVFASKRELVELHKDIANHNATQTNDLYQKLNTISYSTGAVHKCVGDLLVEEERFHREWHDAQARIENRTNRLNTIYAWTNVLRLIINAGILVVLVMYLMDIG
jgi:adenosyl cobinamide kinase/adenosyl cobinamide phosphate guanylyltransferase